MSDIIDFHSHILPGIDDGSDCVETSLAMIQMEWEQGIRRVIATPHFYPSHDHLDLFLRRREESWENLVEACGSERDLPEILLGAEVHFFSGISDLDQLSLLTIDQKPCILLEMPPPPWTEKMYREIGDIFFKQGIMPVIAHIDRYISVFRDFGIPRRLEDLPVMVQANAAFFLRPGTARMAMKMLRRNQIHLIGSDCHNLTQRMPRIGEVLVRIENVLGPEMLEKIRDNQNTVFGK